MATPASNEMMMKLYNQQTEHTQIQMQWQEQSSEQQQNDDVTWGRARHAKHLWKWHTEHEKSNIDGEWGRREKMGSGTKGVCGQMQT